MSDFLLHNKILFSIEKFLKSFSRKVSNLWVAKIIRKKFLHSPKLSKVASEYLDKINFFYTFQKNQIQSAIKKVKKITIYHFFLLSYLSKNFQYQ